jgi:hypothetical protein
VPVAKQYLASDEYAKAVPVEKQVTIKKLIRTVKFIFITGHQTQFTLITAQKATIN